ncbi:MAG: hypothetical protein IJU04_04250 [Ruminococcus sp.]|nr:hypothetical protein [Ruminococcus sp.]
MSEFKSNNSFKEAVCIETMRVFDSCSAQDCLEDLEVTFAEPAMQEMINEASYIKTKSVEVLNTTFNIDPVPFNKGFYTVDLTYSFKVDFDVYDTNTTTPQFATGNTTFSKKVILFGSDGNTKHFASDDITAERENQNSILPDLPRASVSVVDPISLDTKLLPATAENPDKTVLVTIGMFAIVQLQRAVPILIPAYDYCIPNKECSTNTDSPCELFEKISFPTNEFFPRSLDNQQNCDCNNSNGSDDNCTDK